MKVVFYQDVEGTALVGEVKVVKNGFARNFLLPRGLAGAATVDNLQHANSLAEKEARRQAKLDDAATVQRERLEGYTVSLEARVGETGRLYGSITNRDIAAKLQEASGIEIDSRVVLLPEPIRDLGTRTVTVKFTRNVSVDVEVEVVPDEESKDIVAKLLEQKALEEAEAAEAALMAKEVEDAAAAAKALEEAVAVTSEAEEAAEDDAAETETETDEESSDAAE
jgi:large subunit ribosomal protein L9